VAEEKRQLHAIVHGRVQGVSFRYYTLLRAQELGLVGWVRTCRTARLKCWRKGRVQPSINWFRFYGQARRRRGLPMFR